MNSKNFIEYLGYESSSFHHIKFGIDKIVPIMRFL